MSTNCLDLLLCVQCTLMQGSLLDPRQYNYLACVELVTSAGLKTLFLMLKSAAMSGQTISKELHSHSLCPTQQGHPDPLAYLSQVRLLGVACQLCTLPFRHSWQSHQMRLWLFYVVLAGEFTFLLFLSWSHCSSKGCSAIAKVGCFCLVPSASLPLRHPALRRAFCITGTCHSCKQTLHFQWALMLL